MKRLIGIVLIGFAVIGLALMPAMPVQAAPVSAALQWSSPMQAGFELNLVLDVIVQFATLAGVAAAIAAIVNVIKYFGLVSDGNAGRVIAALDLAAIVALVALKIFAPTISANFVDQQAAIFAQIVVAVLGYVMELKVSKASHDTLSELGVPLIGASHSGGTVLRLAPVAK
jgi:hypothetical protein